MLLKPPVDTPQADQKPAHFPPTRWSLVMRAVGEDSCAVRALGELLHVYWQPLYGFARQSGLSAEDAADAVQGFCESLIRRKSIQSTDREAGRLRSFLLGGLRNHLKAAWRNQKRQKRGGDIVFVPEATARAGLEQVIDPALPPDAAYDRLWVRALLGAVLARLRKEYEVRGRAEVYAALEPFISQGGDGAPYAEVAVSLGLSESAVQQSVRRLRLRYRALLEDEIAQTVGSPGDVAEERGHLIAILGGG